MPNYDMQTITGTPVTLVGASFLKALYPALARFIEANGFSPKDGWVRVDADGLTLAHRSDSMIGDVLAQAEAANDAAIELDAILCNLADGAGELEQLKGSVPQSLAEALRLRALFGEQLDEALTLQAHLASQAIDLDDRTGRERRACARLIAEEYKDAAKPPSDTALDKMAGDHPRYVALREELASVKAAREQAEARVKSLTARVELASLFVQAHLRRPFESASPDASPRA
jgi:hypothetical protein